MATLSEKANYLRMINGEVPEYVPRSLWMRCSVRATGFGQPRDLSSMEFTDAFFGIPMVVEPNSGAIPKPGDFLLKDIRQWRDVVKRPAIFDEVNWEMMSKKDLDERDPDLLKFGGGSIGNGYFMMLTYFMGFNEALIAIMEEPDEVKALLNFLLELNLELGRNFLQWYKPDIYSMGDDIAHERAPFVSEEVFMDIFEPMWRQNTAIYKEAGLPAEHHNCGAFYPFVKHIVNMGFNAWNPAQPTFNDLPAIKKEYGNKLSICGGFESNGMVSWEHTTEEEIRAYTREVMDTLAPGGGYAFSGNVMGNRENTNIAERNAWINDEYEKNMYKYY
ncbi:MAG: hypothetical protein FWG88_09865 [Oscillospiraceae bacterium]|nr:hypothetical protein [Oscillospiraceae bacterium]